jgi:hypothetical protein
LDLKTFVGVVVRFPWSQVSIDWLISNRMRNNF